MITVVSKGDFSKSKRFLEALKETVKMGDLDKYGRAGVQALSSATPVASGTTAASWYYEIERSSNSVSVVWKNSNVVDGVCIAMILQYGHGTRNGGWVQGRDYINPAIQPIFDKMANEAWEEVKRV